MEDNNKIKMIQSKRTEEIDLLLTKLSKLLYDPRYTKDAKRAEFTSDESGVTIEGKFTVADAIVSMLTVAKPGYPMETIDDDERATLEVTVMCDDADEDPYVLLESDSIYSAVPNIPEMKEPNDDDEDFDFPDNIELVKAPDDPQFLEKLERLSDFDMVSYQHLDDTVEPTVAMLLDPSGEFIVFDVDELPEAFEEQDELVKRCRVFAHPNGSQHFVMVPVTLARELHLALRLAATEGLTGHLQDIKDGMDDVTAIDGFFADVYAKLGTDPSEIPGDIMCEGDDMLLVNGNLIICEDFDNEDKEYVPIIKLKNRKIFGGNSVELEFSTGVIANDEDGEDDVDE